MAKARRIPGLNQSDPYSSAAAKIVGVRVGELLDHARDVLDVDDIKRVHDMRVATRRLSAQPNAGLPRDIEGRNIYLCSPEYMASYARRFINAGVRLVGGCCGSAPEHLRAMAEALGVKP